MADQVIREFASSVLNAETILDDISISLYDNLTAIAYLNGTPVVRTYLGPDHFEAVLDISYRKPVFLSELIGNYSEDDRNVTLVNLYVMENASWVAQFLAIYCFAEDDDYEFWLATLAERSSDRYDEVFTFAMLTKNETDIVGNWIVIPFEHSLIEHYRILAEVAEEVGDCDEQIFEIFSDHFDGLAEILDDEFPEVEGEVSGGYAFVLDPPLAAIIAAFAVICIAGIAVTWYWTGEYWCAVVSCFVPVVTWWLAIVYVVVTVICFVI